MTLVIPAHGSLALEQVHRSGCSIQWSCMQSLHDYTSKTSLEQSTSRNSSSQVCRVSLSGTSHRLIERLPELGNTWRQTSESQDCSTRAQDVNSCMKPQLHNVICEPIPICSAGLGTHRSSSHDPCTIFMQLVVKGDTGVCRTADCLLYSQRKV